MLTNSLLYKTAHSPLAGVCFTCVIVVLPRNPVLDKLTPDQLAFYSAFLCCALSSCLSCGTNANAQMNRDLASFLILDGVTTSACLGNSSAETAASNSSPSLSLRYRSFPHLRFVLAQRLSRLPAAGNLDFLYSALATGRTDAQRGQYLLQPSVLRHQSFL